jgi:Tol biopolymer transport system component
MTCIFAWVAFVCGYLVLVGSTAIASAESACTPARIVFQSDRDGPYDLYTMNTDGTDVRRISLRNGEIPANRPLSASGDNGLCRS